MRIGGVDGDAKAGESAETVRHEAFAASLIDRRARAIGESHLEPFSARSDGGRPTGRGTADYKYIGRAHERRVSPLALPGTGSSRAATVAGRPESDPARQNSVSRRPV